MLTAPVPTRAAVRSLCHRSKSLYTAGDPPPRPASQEIFGDKHTSVSNNTFTRAKPLLDGIVHTATQQLNS